LRELLGVTTDLTAVKPATSTPAQTRLSSSMVLHLTIMTLYTTRVGNYSYCNHSFPFPWNRSHSHPFPMQHLIPIPIYFSRHLYFHSILLPFPLPAITIRRIIKRIKADKCVYNVMRQVTSAALSIIILHNYYLSFIIS